MSKARHEFGDDVMLLTSRITAPELRHLGDYEVMFALDERGTAPAETTGLVAKPAADGFAQILRQQLAPSKPPSEKFVETPIDKIHSSLVDIGLPPALTEALTALILSSVPRSSVPLSSVSRTAKDSVRKPPPTVPVVPEQPPAAACPLPARTRHTSRQIARRSRVLAKSGFAMMMLALWLVWDDPSVRILK